jgi:hypothetical protein
MNERRLHCGVSCEYELNRSPRIESNLVHLPLFLTNNPLLSSDGIGKTVISRWGAILNIPVSDENYPD